MSSSSLATRRDRRAHVVIILVWAWAILPRSVQTLSAPKVHQNVEQAADPYGHLAALLVTATTLFLAGYCAFVIATSLTDLPRRRFGQLAALLLPWVCITIRDLYIPIAPTRSAVVFPLVATTMWLLRPRLRTLSTLGLLVGATAIASVTIGIMLPTHGIFRLATGDFASEDKQVLPWGILIGVFTQGNNLSQFMVLGMPAIGTIKQRPTRHAMMAFALFATVWGASRSCMAATGIIVVTYVLVRTCRGAARRVAGAVCVALSFGGVLALPLLAHQDTAFSNRGYVWTQSLRAVRNSLGAGLGTNWYSRIASTSGALGPTVFHGHNQFVQLLVTGGFVLVIAVAVMVVVLTGSALAMLAGGNIAAVLYLVALAGAGLMEVSLVFVDNFILAPVVIIPLSYIAFGRKDEAPNDAVPTHHNGSAEDQLGTSTPLAVARRRQSG